MSLPLCKMRGSSLIAMEAQIPRLQSVDTCPAVIQVPYSHCSLSNQLIQNLLSQIRLPGPLDALMQSATGTHDLMTASTETSAFLQAIHSSYCHRGKEKKKKSCNVSYIIVCYSGDIDIA